MSGRARLWALIVGVLAVVLGYFVMSRHPQKAPVEQPAQPPAATMAPAGDKITPSGNYSDDWMKFCGPIQGAGQKDCTSRLDAAYGRVDGAPVPPDRQDGKQ